MRAPCRHQRFLIKLGLEWKQYHLKILDIIALSYFCHLRLPTRVGEGGLLIYNAKHAQDAQHSTCRLCTSNGCKNQLRTLEKEDDEVIGQGGFVTVALCCRPKCSTYASKKIYLHGLDYLSSIRTQYTRRISLQPYRCCRIGTHIGRAGAHLSRSATLSSSAFCFSFRNSTRARTSLLT